MIRLRGLALAAFVLVVSPFRSDVWAQSSSPNDLFPPALFAPLPAPSVPDSDLAVVFWFDTRNPLGTLRHQAHDRRAGEYTPAVEDWLRMVRRGYPHYVVTVRYINVGRRTVDDAVRQALVDERAALAAAVLDARSVTRSMRGPAQAGSVTRRPSTLPYRIGGFGAPGAGGISPNPSASYPFPVPMPYPRPHP